MSTEPQRYSLNGETMGTRYTAVFYAEAGVDTDAINRGLAQAVGRVDQQMSTWKADSDLNRLNAGPEQTWLPVPQETGHGVGRRVAGQPAIRRGFRHRRR